MLVTVRVRLPVDAGRAQSSTGRAPPGSKKSEVNGLVANFLAKKGNNALTKWITPARDRFRDRERDAIDHGDKLALDELQLFRKEGGGRFRRQAQLRLGPAKSERHQRAVRARWDRDPAGIRRGPA